jgi:hypothetical protein
MEPAFGSAVEAWLTGLGIAPPGEEAMLLVAASAVVAGVTTVWLYAVATARYGSGPRTALLVGIAVTVLLCVVPNLGLVAFGVMPPNLFLMYAAWAFVQMPLATLAGAWLYRGPASFRETLPQVPANARN